MNILHIYQICDEYFRFDVTTNVAIALPEIVEFPSLTLCVDLIDSLKWEEMSIDLINRLFNFKTSRQLNETVASRLISNPKAMRAEIHQLWQKDMPAMIQLHFNLEKEKSVAEILNMTESLQELFPRFSTTQLSNHTADLMKVQFLSFRSPDASDFQFTIDMVFIHCWKKCFTISIRPGVKKVYLDDLFALDYKRPSIMSWMTDIGSRVVVYIHAKGYLIRAGDLPITVSPPTVVRTSYVTHETNLLKPPYKTRCRDYTKIGFLSRKHCREMCFKSKTVKIFNSISLDSHGFQSDNIFLSHLPYANTSFFIITQQCKRECLERDCHLVTYLHETKDSNRELIGLNAKCSQYASEGVSDRCLGNLSEHFISPANQVVTRTESQAAIPFISYLTSVFSTCGFWLGLSVSGSALLIKQTWAKAMNLKDKTMPKQRQRSRHQHLIPLQQRLSFLVQSIVQSQQKGNLNVRRKLKSQNKTSYFFPNK